MISCLERDKKRRKLVAQYESKRLRFKSIVHDTSLPAEVRWKASLKLSKLPRNSSKVRIRNRCVLSGRSRGVYRQFKMSRIMLRHLASDGLLTGVKKASW